MSLDIPVSKEERKFVLLTERPFIGQDLIRPHILRCFLFSLVHETGSFQLPLEFPSCRTYLWAHASNGRHDFPESAIAEVEEMGFRPFHDSARAILFDEKKFRAYWALHPLESGIPRTERFGTGNFSEEAKITYSQEDAEAWFKPRLPKSLSRQIANPQSLALETRREDIKKGKNLWMLCTTFWSCPSVETLEPFLASIKSAGDWLCTALCIEEAKRGPTLPLIARWVLLMSDVGAFSLRSYPTFKLTSFQELYNKATSEILLCAFLQDEIARVQKASVIDQEAVSRWNQWVDESVERAKNISA